MSDSPPTLSAGEEIANSISHGLGLLLALIALPILVISAVRIGSTRFMIGAAVFGVTMILLYLASTLYHSVTHDAAKKVFRLFDHSAIFLLIAGTYTPFTLGVLRGTWGWTLLAIIWFLALAGIVVKAVPRTRHSWISMVLYLVMGWLAIVAIKPMFELVPVPGIILIFAGGLAYTGGTIFYMSRRIPFAHAIWHAFVLIGSACHFVAVTHQVLRP